MLNVCEEGENSTSRPFIERVIDCSESAAKFVENVLPIVNECKGELTEVAGNLRVLFHSWCRKLTELGLRNTPNCTHLESISGKFTGTYSERKTRETKVRDQ